jgi:enoyl-CoA hydratase/carnithine racemase
VNKNTDRAAPPSDLILSSTVNGVTTLTMNHPARLNGWTAKMIDSLKASMRAAASDDATRVVILTGADPYYCAGVNLSSTLRLGHPRALHAMIVEHNQALFESFLRFPKPILVAINGPSIGACVTSATLCDAMIASKRATFSTPFSALGVTPEGCSSVHFERLMGAEAAARMLGPEGWRPSAAEALEAGLVQWVVTHDQLLVEAQKIAEGWIERDKQRAIRGGSELAELLEVNARESVAVADSFLDRPFLKGQFKFLWRKKKRGPSLAFFALWATHSLWSRLR